MKLTIVVPVYNDPRVAKALDSILSQELTCDLELIVVDGCSTDQTHRIIDEYKNSIATFISEPDDGAYDAMNKGIALASGDIVGILNSDDRYAGPHVLQSVVTAFKDPSIDACYGNLLYVSADDEVVRYWDSGHMRKAKFYMGWMPPHPTLFLRRHVYERYGTFDTRYPLAADYELMLRLFFINKIQAKYLAMVMVRMATGGQSDASIKNHLRSNLETLRAWRANGLRMGCLPSMLRQVHKVDQWIRRPRSKDNMNWEA
ncbi:MAG: glycosyltransferase family 2 protein [Dehalococcoidia bacterium]